MLHDGAENGLNQTRTDEVVGSDALLAEDTAGAPEDTPSHDGVVSFGRWLLEVVVLVLVAIVLSKGVRTYLFEGTKILSDSMQPTLSTSDRVLVNKLAYRLGSPQPGDVVVFLSPDSNSTDYIKRVVAVEGQTVDIVDGSITVNGQPVVEPYTGGQQTAAGSERLPVTVPQGYVWLMGDNRGNSTDSRFFGPQPVSRLVGKAIVIYWPLERWESL